MTFTHHHNPQDPHEDKRRWTILLATGGVMAVVVVVWAMLLPIQFKQEDQRVAENRDRWTAPKDDGSTDEALRSFRQQVNDLGGRLEAMAETGAGATPTDAAKTPTDGTSSPTTADAIRDAATVNLEATTGEQASATSDAPPQPAADNVSPTPTANTEPTRP